MDFKIEDKRIQQNSEIISQFSMVDALFKEIQAVYAKAIMTERQMVQIKNIHKTCNYQIMILRRNKANERILLKDSAQYEKSLLLENIIRGRLLKKAMEKELKVAKTLQLRIN